MSMRYRLLWIIMVAIKNGWPLQAACNFGLLLWALKHPAVVTVPDVLKTRGRAFERVYLEQFVRFTGSFLNGARLSLDPDLDIVFYVDGDRGEWREFKRQ